MSNELQEVTNNETMPSFLNDYVGKGHEDVNVNELKLPYLSLAQGSTDAVKKGLVKYGEFFDSITSEVLGKEVTIVVIKMEQDWIKFPSKQEKEEARKANKTAFIKRSKDGITWDNGEKLTEDDYKKCKEYVFFCVVRDNLKPLPYIISMKSTSSRSGKHLMNMIGHNMKSSFKGEPIFARAYKLSSKELEGDNGAYLVYNNAQPMGWASQDEVEIANKIRNNIDKYITAKDSENEIEVINDVDPVKENKIPHTDLEEDDDLE